MIALENVRAACGGKPVLERCTLRIAPGEHAALSGPSGCGKTTLLRLVAGLRRPDAGSVRVGGTVAMVFQEPRLFPWLTAERNLALVTREAPRWLEKAGLAGAAGKYPSELSGGMRQRVNICRALAAEADILLLDEPFQGLDAPLRRALAALVAECAAGKTLLLVSHDAEDLALADTLYEYQNGTFFQKNPTP